MAKEAGGVPANLVNDIISPDTDDELDKLLPALWVLEPIGIKAEKDEAESEWLKTYGESITISESGMRPSPKQYFREHTIVLRTGGKVSVKSEEATKEEKFANNVPTSYKSS